MRTIPKRPLLGICMVFLTGLVLLFCASAVSVLPALLCAFGVVLFLLLAFLPRISLQRAFCLLSAAALLSAFFLTQKTLADERSFWTEEPRIVSMTGVVKRLSYANDSGAAFLLDVDTMDGTRVSGKVSVLSQGEHVSYADPGEEVSFHALLGDEACMQYYETYAQSNFADGIYASVRLIDDGTFQIVGKKHGFTALCADIAAFCRQKLYVYLPQDTAALVTGILIGDKSAMSASVIRDFRRVGISHVLAVSGLHVSVLLGGMLRIMTALGMGKRTRLILTAGFLVLFMGITGFSPSVTRAGLMWLLCGISFFVGGRADGLTSLFLAAAIICAVSPTSVFDIGLILSVCATCGILVLELPLNDFLSTFLPSKRMISRIFRQLLSLVGVTLAATIFTLPVSLFVFGEISLLAPVANLLMHIPVTLILYTTPLLLFTSLLPLPPVKLLTAILAWILSSAAKLLCAATSFLAGAEHALIGVRYPFLLPIFILFLLTAAVLIWKTRKMLVLYPIYLCSCVLFFLCMTVYGVHTAKEVRITAQVYKRNDIVTVVSDGKGMLIDASDGSYTAAKVGWQQLSEQNITQLDAYVLTHYHRKHEQTLNKLANSAMIRNLIVPKPLTEDEQAIYDALCAAAEQKKIAVQTYVRGADTVRFGAAEVYVLPRDLLNRSVQPLLGYTITKRNQNGETDSGQDDSVFLYLGSAAFEADDTPLSDGLPSYAAERDRYLFGDDTDILYLGAHGPLTKVGYGDAWTDIPRLSCLLLADEEQASFCGQALSDGASSVYILTYMDSIRMIFD